MTDELIFPMGKFDARIPTDQDVFRKPSVDATGRCGISGRIDGLFGQNVAGRLFPQLGPGIEHNRSEKNKKSERSRVPKPFRTCSLPTMERSFGSTRLCWTIPHSLTRMDTAAGWLYDFETQAELLSAARVCRTSGFGLGENTTDDQRTIERLNFLSPSP